MMQPMARRTEGDEVVQIVPAAGGPRFDVMNLQKSAISTAGRPTTKAVAAEDFDSSGWGNGGCVGLAGAFDAGVAFCALGVGLGNFDFTPAGLNG